MHTPITSLKVAAALCGATLIAAQVIQNVEHMGQATAFSGLGLAAIAVPIAMAVVVPVAQHAWSRRAYVSVALAVVVLACGIGHTLVVALERGTQVRDLQIAARSNFNFDLAKDARDQASARVRELEGLLLAEGKTGCRKACEAVKAALEDARAQARRAQADLAKVGAPVDQNGLQRRYGHAAQWIDAWHPLLLPLAMELGGWVLVGFAFQRGSAAPVSQAEPRLRQSKVDKAAEAIRQLKAEQGGTIGSIRRVSKRIGYSHGTTQRAFKVVAR